MIRHNGYMEENGANRPGAQSRAVAEPSWKCRCGRRWLHGFACAICVQNGESPAIAAKRDRLLQAAMDRGLKRTQADVLVALVDGELAATELADRLSLGVGDAMRRVGTVMGRGLVERAGIRGAPIALTRAGWQALGLKEPPQ